MGSLTMLEWTTGALLVNAVKGVALLAVVWALAIVLRRAPAAWRHALWLSGLAAVLLLPIVSTMAPAIDVSVAWMQRAEPAQPNADESSPVAPAAHAMDHAAVFAPSAEPATRIPQREGGSSQAIASVATLAAEGQSATRPASIDWGWLLARAWLLIAAALLAPYIAGRLFLWRIRAAGTPLRDEAWESKLHEICAQLGIRRRVLLVASDRALVPMTWGVLRPVVLVPAAADSWNDAQKRMVLAHELAHVRRCDCLSDSFARLVRALYWFNPLAWLALRRLHAEREAACDAWVLRLGHAPSAYAEALVRIALDLRHPRLLQAAGLAMARSSAIHGRVREILRPSLGSRRGYMRITVAVALAFVLACGLLAAVRFQRQPTLVSQYGEVFRVPVEAAGLERGGEPPLEVRIVPGDTADSPPKLTLSNLPIDSLRAAELNSSNYRVRDSVAYDVELKSTEELSRVLKADSTIRAVTLVVGAAETPIDTVLGVMEQLKQAGVESVQIRGEGTAFGMPGAPGAPGFGGMAGLGGMSSMSGGFGGGGASGGVGGAMGGFGGGGVRRSRPAEWAQAQGGIVRRGGTDSAAGALSVSEIQNQLKQMGLVFKMYARESKGTLWPPRDPAHFMPQIDKIYPEYIADPETVAFVKGELGVPVVYTGYALDEELGGAYIQALTDGNALIGEVFEGSDTPSRRSLQPLREGVERFFITDINNPAASALAQSQIPVLWTMPSEGAGHVLFMDGHVEKMQYPGRFPMTEAFIQGLSGSSLHQDGVVPPGAVPGMGGGGASEGAAMQLKKLGLVFKMFANEHKGLFPPSMTPEGILMPAPSTMYPEWVTEPALVDFFSGKSGVRVVYPGYVIHDEASGERFLDALRSDKLNGEAVEFDDVSLMPIREGVERFLITDINDPSASAKTQAMIPIMWTMPDSASGADVLFMDGHVAHMAYPGGFPMTEKFIEGLKAALELHEAQAAARAR